MLRDRLPQQVNEVAAALTRPAELGRAAAGYLRAAITAATHDVYLGLAVAAAATLVSVLVIVPRWFTTAAGGAASAGPAAQAAPAGEGDQAGRATRAASAREKPG